MNLRKRKRGKLMDHSYHFRQLCMKVFNPPGGENFFHDQPTNRERSIPKGAGDSKGIRNPQEISGTAGLAGSHNWYHADIQIPGIKVPIFGGMDGNFEGFLFYGALFGVGTVMTPAKGSHAVGMAIHQICSSVFFV